MLAQLWPRRWPLLVAGRKNHRRYERTRLRGRALVAASSGRPFELSSHSTGLSDAFLPWHYNPTLHVSRRRFVIAILREPRHDVHVDVGQLLLGHAVVDNEPSTVAHERTLDRSGNKTRRANQRSPVILV